jgi:hypothetical protein
MSDLINLKVTTWGKSTPILNLLIEELEDTSDLNEEVAIETQEMVRLWIIEAAADRHHTANDLGATPTGYLTKAAEETIATASSKGAVVTVKGQIFKRFFGAVQVLPRRARMLSIPVSAESYGKKTKDFGKMSIIKGKSGDLLLVRTTGRGKNKKVTPLFLLLRRVTLPQDKGLLPGPKRRAETAERAARDYLAKVIQAGGLKR